MQRFNKIGSLLRLKPLYPAFVGGGALLILFFLDFLVFGKLPIPSADPAVIYHYRVEAAQWLQSGIFHFWKPVQALGTSLFATPAAKTQFNLSSLFIWLGDDPQVSYVLFVVFLAILLFGSAYWYMQTHLMVLPAIAWMGAGLWLFTPGFHNEFLFNTFGGVCMVPFMLAIANKFFETRDLRLTLWLTGLLLGTYWISNIAMVQFALMYLGLYYVYMVLSDGWRPNWELLRATTIFYFMSIVLFLGIAAYYVLPFFNEIVLSERAHLYNIYGFYSSK